MSFFTEKASLNLSFKQNYDKDKDFILISKEA